MMMTPAARLQQLCLCGSGSSSSAATTTTTAAARVAMAGVTGGSSRAVGGGGGGGAGVSPRSFSQKSVRLRLSGGGGGQGFASAGSASRRGREQLLKLKLRTAARSPAAAGAVVNCHLSSTTSAPPAAAASSSLAAGVSDSLVAANPHEEHSQHYRPLVKMCGITSAEDASLAAQAGACYVGMIMWPHSKRSVRSMALAREICAAAREFGAEPVGVFVSESAAEIERACDAANLSFAQLHGDGARASVLELPRSLKTVFVLQSDAQGRLQTTISPEQEKVVDWVLVDGLEGGSGSTFAWHNFKVPSLCRKKGWLLAGGLNPENVAQAISILRPDAVDVASGIAGSDGIRKDPSRIFAFMEAVRASSGSTCLSV